jgi:hypothetical protein
VGYPNCHKCPEGQVALGDKCVPQCPEGLVGVPPNCHKCPDGMVAKGQSCYACPKNEILTPEGCKCPGYKLGNHCFPCPPGFLQLPGPKCVQCPKDAIPMILPTPQCYQCPAGEVALVKPGLATCVKACPKGEVGSPPHCFKACPEDLAGYPPNCYKCEPGMYSEDHVCKSLCPAGLKWTPNGCTCPDGMVKKGDACVAACPAGQAGTPPDCHKPCPDGWDWMKAQGGKPGQCVNLCPNQNEVGFPNCHKPCPLHFAWGGNPPSCYNPCPALELPTGGIPHCMKCPPGQAPNGSPPKCAPVQGFIADKAQVCPPGKIGFPHCHCPEGKYGPNCDPAPSDTSPKLCPLGHIGTPPNCRRPCQPGQIFRQGRCVTLPCARGMVRTATGQCRPHIVKPRRTYLPRRTPQTRSPVRTYIQRRASTRARSPVRTYIQRRRSRR